jgi:TRAP-type C4-dicarboxylate transport system substrate-binding protein
MRPIALAILLIAQPAVAQTVWRGATEYPATSMPGEGLATLARLLNDRTAGQVQLQPRYDAPDGLRSATIPAAVQNGQIEVGDAFAGTLAAVDPVFQLSSLPFLATSQDQAWALYQTARAAYVAAYATLGQRLLYATPWPASGIWSTNAMTGPEPLQGLAIRTYDATSTNALRRAGAAAVELSFADAMPRLKDGSVVAVLSSGDGGAGRKLWDYARHFTAIGYAMPLSFTTVSDRAYQALPPTLRADVDSAAAETEALQWQVLIRRTERNYATMTANGVSIEQPGASLAARLAAAGRAETDAWRSRVPPKTAAILDAYVR